MQGWMWLFIIVSIVAGYEAVHRRWLVRDAYPGPDDPIVTQHLEVYGLADEVIHVDRCGTDRAGQPIGAAQRQINFLGAVTTLRQRCDRGWWSSDFAPVVFDMVGAAEQWQQRRSATPPDTAAIEAAGAEYRRLVERYLWASRQEVGIDPRPRRRLLPRRRARAAA